MFASTGMMEVPVVTDRSRGAIGVDPNADHLAVCETDASGNPVHAFSEVPLVTNGDSAHQTEAVIGDAVAVVVGHVREAGKPIVIERLDFRQTKAPLEGESHKYSRMLSSFSYGRVKAYFISRGYRQRVEVHQVNPAYSFRNWQGEVHGALWAQRSPGSGPGAGPVHLWRTRLFRAHPPPVGGPHRHFRSRRLYCTQEVVREARVNVLGFSPAETP